MNHQSTGVAVAGRAVLITGMPGCGKSSLALALIDRGATLIGDDAITLTKGEGALHASPPQNIAGLLEVRGVGLITLPTTSAPVSLIVALGEDGERLPSPVPTTDLAGFAIPTLSLAAPDWTTPLRIEQALAHFGTEHHWSGD